MTPTDEEIDVLWSRLAGTRPNPSALEIDAANMLLALKARAEAAERLIENSGSALEAASLIARAEAAEKREADLRDELAQLREQQKEAAKDAYFAALEAKP